MFKVSFKNAFRYLFIAGVCITLFSIFLNYYTIRIYNSTGVLLTEVSYSLIFGWRNSTSYTSSSLSESFDFTENPILPFVGILLPTLFISLYGVLFKDYQGAKNLIKLKLYSYSHLLLAGLIIFLVFIYPYTYFISSQLFYPILMLDFADEVVYYSIDIGYLLLLGSVICILPYALIYSMACQKFSVKNYAQQHSYEAMKKRLQKEVDLDKYIAEEKTELGIPVNEFYRGFEYKYRQRRYEGIP